MKSSENTVQSLRHFSHSLKDNGFHLLAFILTVFAFIFTGIDLTKNREISTDRALPEVKVSHVKAEFNRQEAQNWLTQQATVLAQKLSENHILHATVYNRVKSEDSAREKAARKGIPYTELNDFYGLRVVVDNELDVYETLNLICSTYPTVPGTMKNYIVAPKDSGYQSVHVVAEIENRRVEFQLRTNEMHQQAEAEHEAYKVRMRAAA